MRIVVLAVLLLALVAGYALSDPASDGTGPPGRLPAVNLQAPLPGGMAPVSGSLSLGDPMASNASLFGQPTLRVTARGGANGIVGISDNDTPAGTLNFPTGTTGYGNLSSAGGTVFGLFGRADLRGSGTATNEVNAFNYCGQPSSLLPPDTAFGTVECNAIPLQVIPYGNFNNSIGVLFGSGSNDAGTAPILLRTGIYMRPNSFSDHGIFLDGSAADTAPALTVVRGGAGQHIELKSVGSAAPQAAVMSYQDAGGKQAFAVQQNGGISGYNLTLVPIPFASLPAPTPGTIMFCSDCFQPSTTSRGTLVFGTGTTWMALASSAATH